MKTVYRRSVEKQRLTCKLGMEASDDYQDMLRELAAFCR
jgi:hypothetical protein